MESTKLDISKTGGFDETGVVSSEGNTQNLDDAGIRAAQEEFEAGLRNECNELAEAETDTFFNWLNVEDDVIIQHLPGCIVTGKQIGRASCRERVSSPV